jgi:two-component system CheB/CheR fusion protein
MRISRKAPTFPIVGIGASAGGLEAFRELLSHLRPDTGAAFVLIQHLDPTHASLLVEALDRSTTMPLVQATDGLRVEPNHVYVIPPNTLLTLRKGALALKRRDAGRRAPMAIDRFFLSLALERRQRAVGVILSGTASDGTLGLKAIRAAGGLALAQDPATCKFGGMPESAIAAGAVDSVLPLDRIAARLATLSERDPREATVVPDALDTIFRLLREATGVDFTQYKQTTVTRRVARRVAARKAKGLSEYARLLRKDPTELALLYEDIFVRVTGFFRDPTAFEALVQRVFPDLLRRRTPGSPIRIWVTACATGEEAYSVAMALLESLGERTREFPIQIFGSDISEQAIQHARVARYPAVVARELGPARLARFFTKVDGGYRINKNVRDLCVFVRHDLNSDPPFSRMDLITCRNALIYFGPELKKRIVSIFHYALNQPGFLMLGRTEALVGFAALFSAVDKTNKIYARRPAGSRPALSFARANRLRAPGSARGRAVAGAASDLELQRDVDQLLLARFDKAGVIVDDDLTIIQFRGRTGPYLEPSPGQANLNLLRMARPGLSTDLRLAIHAAQKEGLSARREGVRFQSEGASRVVTIEVIVLRGGGEAHARRYLVLFEDASKAGRSGSPQKAPRAGRPALRAPKGTRPPPIEQLQHELAATREFLQSVIDQHARTNEELQQTNDELLSSNEELQSTNEELETAKEELQSGNEELTTVNEEVLVRNQELARLSDDLQRSLDEARRARDYADGIVQTVGTPLLIFDEDLRAISANRALGSTFQLSVPPGGSPLEALGPGPWQAPEVRRIVRGAGDEAPLADVEVSGDVPTLGARQFVLNARWIPAPTSGKRLLLLAIDDVTDRRAAEAARAHVAELERETRLAIKAAEEKDLFLALLSHELRTPLNSILLWAQHLQSGRVSPAKIAHGVDSITRSARMQARLIDDLLDVSGIVSGKLQVALRSVALAPIVEGALEQVQPQADEKGVKLEVALAANLGHVNADPDRLRQVIWNLATNAVKFTPAGGSVRITVDQAGAEARIEVRDTGVGIEPAFLPRVFDRFAQADSTGTRTHGGLGLGLAIVAHLVARHGGTIRASSSGVGRGATFTVTLPLMTAGGEGDAGGTTARPERDGRALDGLRVLVVDDDASSREAISETLLGRGATVETAATVDDALAKIGGGPRDVILCDLSMPEEDGYAFLRRLRALPANEGGLTPVAALTANASSGDGRRALEAGFQLHLAKPIDADALTLAVSRLARRDAAPRA